MSFPINTGIPAANNDPADDQPIMQQNFANISGFLSVDHVAPGTSLTAGYHQQVHLLNESAPGLGNANGVLYANLAAAQSWPFWQNALGSLQLAGPTTAAANNGTVLITGGIILKWGFVNSVASTGSVAFSPVFPTSCFMVQLTMRISGPGGTGHVGSIYANDTGFTAAGFTWAQADLPSSATGFYWFAIGN